MSGYLYSVAKQGTQGSKAVSPVLALETFKRKALIAFDRKVEAAKKGGAKLGEVEEFEVVPFEQDEQERVVMKRCAGTDKGGQPLTIFLERFHVGGQLAARQAEAEEG